MKEKLEEKIKVLFVEDKPEQVDLIKNQIPYLEQKYGVEITIAETYKQYKEISKEKDFEAVITDLFFPYSDEKESPEKGVELWEELGNEIKSIQEFEGKLAELKGRLETSNNRDNNVVLSSIHSSKGLEYNNVFLIDNNHGEFPPENREEIDFEKTLEEERRIFYVGMTRAKNNLHVLSSGKESLFFNELKYILNNKGGD